MKTFELFGYKITIEKLGDDKYRAKELLRLAHLNNYSNSPKIALIKALRAKEPEKYGSNVEGGLGLKYAKHEVERLFDFSYDPPRIK